MKKCLKQGIFKWLRDGGGGATVFELGAEYFKQVGKSIAAAAG